MSGEHCPLCGASDYDCGHGYHSFEEGVRGYHSFEEGVRGAPADATPVDTRTDHGPVAYDEITGHALGDWSCRACEGGRS